MKQLRDIRDDGHVKVEKRDVRYRGHILNLVTDELALASTGSKMMREYITHDDAVAVLPIREGDGGPEVLLIRQYRHPTRSVLWEIPAGLIDKPGEEPVQAAERELAEETGMAAAEYEFLARFYTSPGCSDELLTVITGRNAGRDVGALAASAAVGARGQVLGEDVEVAVHAGGQERPDVLIAIE